MKKPQQVKMGILDTCTLPEPPSASLSPPPPMVLPPVSPKPMLVPLSKEEKVK
jgi:hypothetical protein